MPVFGFYLVKQIINSTLFCTNNDMFIFNYYVLGRKIILNLDLLKNKLFSNYIYKNNVELDFL